MIRSFAEAEEVAEKVGAKRISVLRAEDREFLLALKEAHRRGYGEPILIGDGSKIRMIADKIGFDISRFQLVDERDPQEMAYIAVCLVSSGDAHMILRGHIDGHYLFRALIKSPGVKRRISVVALIQLPALPKLIGMTDPGINIAPRASEKIVLIQNAVDLFSRLGHDNPRVGILTAGRGMNTDLDSVADAMEIKNALSRGELTGCTIDEGLCLSDFILGKEGILENHDEIDLSLIPDILLAHNLEFANIFSKIDSLSEKDYFRGFIRHGVIMGAGMPVTIPSRADMHDTIITDIALGVLLAQAVELKSR